MILVIRRESAILERGHDDEVFRVRDREPVQREKRQREQAEAKPRSWRQRTSPSAGGRTGGVAVHAHALASTAVHLGMHALDRSVPRGGRNGSTEWGLQP